METEMAKELIGKPPPKMAGDLLQTSRGDISGPRISSMLKDRSGESGLDTFSTRLHRRKNGAKQK
jgi:hypothetical protein